MKERKCVKLKVNMYEDTKFKIIDMKPERDLIHYIWTRLITLAGKVNLEGRLYMSKNIPYTIETLAIEFNRGTYQVKLALDVFVELEMIELTKDDIYIVKNFVKHQNIKVKEKNKDEEEDVKIKEDLKHEIYDNRHKQSKNRMSEMYDNEVEDTKNKISRNKAEIIGNDEIVNLETTHKDINKIENIDISKIDKRKNKVRDIRKIGNKDSNNTSNNIYDEKNNNLQDNMTILLETKNKNKVNNKKNTINCYDIEEENQDNSIVKFFEGEEGRPLREGECVVEGWSF